MKITEIGEILTNAQLASLMNLGIHNAADIREANDETILDVKGIGPATLEKIRDWAKLPPKREGEAIAKRYMLLKKGEDRLDVSPGDIIPPEFDPEVYVNDGKAKWRE